MRRKRALRSSSEWHSILSEEPNPTWKATSSSHHPATCRDVVFCFCGYGLQEARKGGRGERRGQCRQPRARHPSHHIVSLHCPQTTKSLLSHLVLFHRQPRNRPQQQWSRSGPRLCDAVFPSFTPRCIQRVSGALQALCRYLKHMAPPSVSSATSMR